MELSDSKKHTLIFGGAMIAAGLVLATVVFPFWNLIREDVYAEAIILSNDGGTCYADAGDESPKTIKNCTASKGDTVSIRYGQGLAWAEIIGE